MSKPGKATNSGQLRIPIHTFTHGFSTPFVEKRGYGTFYTRQRISSYSGTRECCYSEHSIHPAPPYILPRRSLSLSCFSDNFLENGFLLH